MCGPVWPFSDPLLPTPGPGLWQGRAEGDPSPAVEATDLAQLLAPLLPAPVQGADSLSPTWLPDVLQSPALALHSVEPRLGVPLAGSRGLMSLV